MSNAVTYALDRIIRSDIPRPVLEVAFLSRISNTHKGLSSLNDRIREEVINPRVLVDCNILHGTNLTIPLSMCEKLDWSYYQTVYRIPKAVTGGRAVISVLELTAAAGNVITMDGNGGNLGGVGLYANNLSSSTGYGAVAGAAKQVLNSVSPITSVSNALVYLIGDNTVIIKDSILIPTSMHLRVMVENDTDFNHIQRPYYIDFYNLVEAAVEAYIYNLIVVEQDSVLISSGGELNRFRDIVEEFRESKEKYNELCDTWYRCALLNDDESARTYYQGVVGGGW